MTAPATSSPPALTIVEIPNKDCVRNFRCGVRQIDDWASGKSFKHPEKNRARVFCAMRADSGVAAGFYALSFSPVNSNVLFGQDKDLYSDGIAPIVFIDWIGVQRSHQNQKVGTVMLIDALRRAYYVSRHVPVYGVALRSLNEQTTKFYEKNGFVVRDEATNPLMIIPYWTIRDLFQG
jgi:GNAT superfamily N-acetyltransferase